MKRVHSGLAVLMLFASAAGHAADYTFSTTYDGTTAVLDAGSADPRGQSLLEGDSFAWTLNAVSTHEWRVITSGSFFPLMGFGLQEDGLRTGDYSLVLKNNGSNVFTTSAVGSVQSLVHLGTNEISLAQGLVFDQLTVSYSLTSSVTAAPDVIDPNDPPFEPMPQTTTFSGGALLPIFGAPDYFSPAIVFAPVPEPQTWLLMLGGIAGLLASKRRRSA